MSIEIFKKAISLAEKALSIFESAHPDEKMPREVLQACEEVYKRLAAWPEKEIDIDYAFFDARIMPLYEIAFSMRPNAYRAYGLEWKKSQAVIAVADIAESIVKKDKNFLDCSVLASHEALNAPDTNTIV